MFQNFNDYFLFIFQGKMSVSFLTGEELYNNEGKNMFFTYLLQKHCNANCSNQLSLCSQVAPNPSGLRLK